MTLRACLLLKVNVSVTDVNDNEPEFIFPEAHKNLARNKFFAYVTEDTKISTSVLQVAVSTLDARISYRFIWALERVLETTKFTY